MTTLLTLCLTSLLLAGSGERADGNDEWIRLLEEFAPSSEGEGLEATPSVVGLQIASQRFERVNGEKGAITLVGVTHIGDAGYYAALAEELAGFDLVLYESVAPDGAKRARADTDLERVRATRAAMPFVGRALEWHRMRTGALPETLAELIESSASTDSRFPGWLRIATVDAWGEPLRLEIIAGTAEVDPTSDSGVPLEPPPTSWRVSSLGADRVPGGEGFGEDLRLDSADLVVSPPSRGGVQAEIASVLGLSFQLHALDYAGENWQLADMTDAELADRASVLDVDVGPLMEGLSGGGLTARMGRMVLMLVRIADLVSGNQVRDIVKVILIEALANPEALEMAQQTGAPGMGGLMELILDDRNRVALECLDEFQLVAPEASVALFYGAAHMPGLAEGLETRGWTAVEEPSWLTAIEVDLEASKVDPDTMTLVRRQMAGSLGLPATRGRTPEDEAGADDGR
jgi:hypothetical protein